MRGNVLTPSLLTNFLLSCVNLKSWLGYFVSSHQLIITSSHCKIFLHGQKNKKNHTPDAPCGLEVMFKFFAKVAFI
jgi:hypothetical protein